MKDKTHPLAPGWVGRISLCPYPHAGVKRQQHIAQTWDRKNIPPRIGAADASVKPASVAYCGANIFFCIVAKTMFIA